MSNSFRDRGRFGDRFKNKSGEEILQNLREQLDQDKKMFFDSTPTWGESASSKSPFSRPGFPFDDPEDSRLPRTSRLQKHLDELANRHPEFADHLRPDISGNFRTWGPRNRRSSGGSGGTGVFSSEDEASDNRSQASGGSEMSGGMPEQSNPGPEEGSRGYNKLPQYGLRNTVDLGGAAQKLQESERNQRSWSAPPDARSTEPGQPKRFISRIEIQPKIPGAQPSPPQPTQSAQPQPASPPVYSSSPGKPPMAPKPPTNKSGGNVRHIPIFVEGRDEPVLARDSTDAPKPTPSREEHFPSHADHFQSDFPGNSHFSDPFSDHPFADRFSRPQFANAFHQQNYGPQQHNFRSQPSQGFHPQPQQQQPVPPQKRPTASQTPPTKRPTDSPAPSAPTPPPPAPPSNDPLAKVAAVQHNVDALTEQVGQFTGNSRKDKQYIYLDEMLTRNLIQLDDIETQGKENIRQARKDTIRSIQRAISLLESKAPINESTKTEDVSMDVTEGETNAEETDSKSDVCVGGGCPSKDTSTEVKTEEAMDLQTEGGNVKETEVPAEVDPNPEVVTVEPTSDTNTSDNIAAAGNETKPAESGPV